MLTQIMAAVKPMVNKTSAPFRIEMVDATILDDRPDPLFIEEENQIDSVWGLVLLGIGIAAL